jgi:hypothetical protein
LRSFEARQHLRDKPDPITFHDRRHTYGTLAVQVYPVVDGQAYKHNSAQLTPA